MKVYQVTAGEITEYGLISETKKTFQVRFLSGSGLQTRIKKEHDAYSPGSPRKSHQQIATTCINEALATQRVHLESLISYHKEKLEAHSLLLSQNERL